MALLFVILEGNRTRKCNPFVVFLNLSFLVLTIIIGLIDLRFAWKQ